MNSPSLLRPICLILSALAIGVGGLVLLRSLTFLRGISTGDLIRGASGFVGSAILLIAAGLLSLTILATRPARSGAKEPIDLEIA